MTNSHNSISAGSASGTTHKLKTWPRYFDDVLSGRKSFEWRVAGDREFAVGDILVLQEWEPARENLACKEGRYTGREIRKAVEYVFSPFATNERTVVMAITDERVSRDDAQPALSHETEHSLYRIRELASLMERGQLTQPRKVGRELRLLADGIAAQPPAAPVEKTDTNKVWGAAEACWASRAPRAAVDILYYEILRLNGGTVTGGDINNLAAPQRSSAESETEIKCTDCGVTGFDEHKPGCRGFRQQQYVPSAELRAATEQQPIYYRYRTKLHGGDWMIVRPDDLPKDKSGWEIEPLYSAVPQGARVSLLDDELLIEWGRPDVAISIDDDGFGYAIRRGNQFEPGVSGKWSGAVGEIRAALSLSRPNGESPL